MRYKKGDRVRIDSVIDPCGNATFVRYSKEGNEFVPIVKYDDITIHDPLAGEPGCWFVLKKDIRKII